MTRNQLTYWQNKEAERHNRAQEAADIERNRINDDHYVRGDSETARHNLAYETETNRHNVETENIDRAYKTTRGINYLAGAAGTVAKMLPSSPSIDVTRTTTTQTFPSGSKQVTATTTTKSTQPVAKGAGAKTPAAGTVTNGVSRFIENLGPAVAVKFMAAPITQEKRDAVKKLGDKTGLTELVTKHMKSKRKKENNNEKQ